MANDLNTLAANYGLANPANLPSIAESGGYVPAVSGSVMPQRQLQPVELPTMPSIPTSSRGAMPMEEAAPELPSPIAANARPFPIGYPPGALGSGSYGVNDDAALFGPMVGRPMPRRAEAAPAGLTEAPATALGGAGRAAAAVEGGMPAELAAMLARYAPKQSVYADELKAARARASKETDAFNKLLERALSEDTSNKPSKAETYFRLAAAFGSPTKTGAFTENLALAGKEMADVAKAEREGAKADKAAKLQLAITGAKARADSAKEDLTTLRTLAGEEMKDARALTSKVIESYVKSGEADSTAGKQAADEGLKRGTPEFQKRVKEIADQNVERLNTQIQSMIAQMGVAQAQVALAGRRTDLAEQQAARLTPAEVKLKTDTEDALSATSSAMQALDQAFKLNPQTFDNTLTDRAQRTLLEKTQGDNPKVVATRTMENLLRSQALAKLKDTFPGAISNDERKALEALQGLDAASVKERGIIIKNAYNALKRAQARQTKRLNEINRGLYRDVDPNAGAAE
jgi:hypothetical protein